MFSENCDVYEIKYGRARQATDGIILRRIFFACWTIKATNIHMWYLLLFHGIHFHASAPECYVCTYFACLVWIVTTKNMWTFKSYAAGVHKFWTNLETISILGARRVTWSKFHAWGPTVVESPGTACSVHVKWYTFFCVRKINAVIMLKILGVVIQNVVARATWLSGFM